LGQVLVIAVLIAGLLLISITTPVRAHSTGGETVVAVYGTTPTVNGIISAGEWDDASTVTFTVTDGATCTVYVKQDGSHLYVAFDILDATGDNLDLSEVYLDVEHDGGENPRTDDLLFKVRRDGVIKEGYVVSGGWVLRDPDGWTAARLWHTGTGWQTEYSIPYSKIGVTAGEEKTLGVMFKTYDQTPGSSFGWPHDWSYMEPDTWADLTSPSPWFWIPEIPSSLVAIALILAAVIAYPHMRKLHT